MQSTASCALTAYALLLSTSENRLISYLGLISCFSHPDFLQLAAFIKRLIIQQWLSFGYTGFLANT